MKSKAFMHSPHRKVARSWTSTSDVECFVTLLGRTHAQRTSAARPPGRVVPMVTAVFFCWKIGLKKKKMGAKTMRLSTCPDDLEGETGRDSPEVRALTKPLKGILCPSLPRPFV